MSTSKRALSEPLADPRPRKTRAVSPPPPSAATLPLPARHASPPRAPPFQQPAQLLSFSYTPQRTLEWNDTALRYYVPPPPGADLGRGYAAWARRAEERPRVDALLRACVRPECASAHEKAGVVAWRGVVTKIMTAPYEDREGWALNVMCVRGTVYIEEHLTAEQLRDKDQQEGRHRLMTYYGYAFEAYCTADTPGAEDRAVDGWGGDVDTNVQWCSVVKTRLGDVRLLLGGEVDCVRDRYTGQPDTFVELKTSLGLRPGNRHDAAKFEKKMLKFHIQSFLLGVPEIVIGFRSPAGRLQAVESFRTLDLPRIAHGAWDPAVSLAWGNSVFTFLRANVGEAGEEAAVWRAVFTPGEGVVLRRLEAEEEADVRGESEGEERVGFLPRWFWDAVGGGTAGARAKTEPVTAQVRGWQL